LAPTYSQHARVAELAGHNVVEVADVTQLVESRIAIVVNPNNPDGPIVRQHRGASLLWASGLRLSFPIAPQEIAARIATALGPWPIAGAALGIGNTALADMAWREKTRGSFAEAAAGLDGLFAKSGLEVMAGTSLFRLVRTRDAAQLFQRLGEVGILVRRFAEYPRLASLRAPRPRVRNNWQSVCPAAGVRLGRFKRPLRLFRQEPCDHPHGKLNGNLARPAFLELLAEPPVNFFVTGLKADGDFFQHLHQRFCRHRAPPIDLKP
jgi:hypothetical protein